MANFVEIIKLFFLTTGWWLIPIIIIFVYKKRLGKYPVECIIYEKRGENLVHTNDMAGRFEDPVTEYKLKKSKDTIPIPNYDWILQNTTKPTNLFEKFSAILTGKIGTITLFKYGSKQYKPVDVKVGDKVVRKFKEVKGKNGETIWITVYEPINVKKEMSRLDFDVIDWDDINHMTQELRAITMRRSPIKGFLEKWGPMIGLGVVAMVIIVTTYLGYQFMRDAGNVYIQATQGGNAPPTQTTPASGNPLGIIPGQ